MSIKKTKRHSKRSQAWKIFWQAVATYLSLHIAAYFEKTSDWPIAIKAIIIGSLAAGVSAVWNASIKDSESTGPQDKNHEDLS